MSDLRERDVLGVAETEIRDGALQEAAASIGDGRFDAVTHVATLANVCRSISEFLSTSGWKIGGPDKELEFARLLAL